MLLVVALAASAGAVATWIVAVECGCRGTSRAQIAQAEVAARQSAFSAFGAVHRAYCTSGGQQLIPNALEHDPWGNPYMFICNAHAFTVVSAGEDGIYMTDDDIRSDR